MALKKAKDESMASVVEQIEQENIRQLNDSVVDDFREPCFKAL